MEIVYGDDTVEETEHVIGLQPICKACHKTFATASSLKRHEGRNPVCVQWNAQHQTDTEKEKINVIDFLNSLTHAILFSDTKATTLSNTCRYCATSFVSSGNLIKHFKHSTVCSRLAMEELYTRVMATRSQTLTPVGTSFLGT